MSRRDSRREFARSHAHPDPTRNHYFTVDHPLAFREMCRRAENP